MLRPGWLQESSLRTWPPTYPEAPALVLVSHLTKKRERKKEKASPVLQKSSGHIWEATRLEGTIELNRGKQEVCPQAGGVGTALVGRSFGHHIFMEVRRHLPDLHAPIAHKYAFPNLFEALLRFIIKQ